MRRDDSGFTLVELLVAMSIMMVIVVVSMSVVVMSSEAATTTRQVQNLNEEARHAINRMARDLRQAEAIVTAVDPDGPSFDASHIVAVRFQGDFDGDGCIGGVGPSCLPYNPSNPEDITYCFEPSTAQLYVIDNQAPGVTPVTPTSTACDGGQPLLAGNVSSFKITYRSSDYRYDLNPTDGVTTWLELDERGLPVGNNNGALDVETANVNSLVLEVTTSIDSHSQAYRTQVDLRNLSQ
jgi:type II secretory pathway pseudopilin PulG